jgi:hypothetical protein
MNTMYPTVSRGNPEPRLSLLIAVMGGEKLREDTGNWDELSDRSVQFTHWDE